jgi:hypothetical protein
MAQTATTQKARQTKKRILAAGEALREQRDKMGLSLFDMTLELRSPQGTLYLAESGKDSVSEAFAAYARWMTKRVGAEWEMDAALALVEQIRQSVLAAPVGERLATAERAFYPVSGAKRTRKRATRAKARHGKQPTIKEMGAGAPAPTIGDGADVAQPGRATGLPSTSASRSIVVQISTLMKRREARRALPLAAGAAT